MTSFHTIKWLDSGLVSMIDQRKLPHDVIYNEYQDPAAVAGAIKDMVIRGAPAIGAAAAYGLALVPWHDETGSLEEVYQKTWGSGADSAGVPTDCCKPVLGHRPHDGSG